MQFAHFLHPVFRLRHSTQEWIGLFRRLWGFSNGCEDLGHAPAGTSTHDCGIVEDPALHEQNPPWMKREKIDGFERSYIPPRYAVHQSHNGELESPDVHHREPSDTRHSATTESPAPKAKESIQHTHVSTSNPMLLSAIVCHQITT